MELRHDSVLMNEVLDQLAIEQGDTVVDGTVGGAGHFREIFARLGAEGTLVGIDADAEALGRARAVVSADMRAERPKVHFVEDNFRNMGRILDAHGVESVSKVLLDLGWSGFQLAGGRGFSFQADEPLLMTYGKHEPGKSAADLVNTLSETELADLIYEFGEEHASRRIAKAIVEARRKERILSTAQLAAVVASAVHTRGKTNPATKTFQALRIAVNDEFGALKEGMRTAFDRLVPHGRLAIISFHSTEDRIVKEFMRSQVAEGTGALVTKKPLAPSAAELAKNRRARSAKLRVIEKLPLLASAATLMSSVHHVYA
jgi:16S rRNA (cytosine1402-N4)-methyltransferase